MAELVHVPVSVPPYAATCACHLMLPCGEEVVLAGEEVEHLPGRLPRRVGQAAAAASWELQAGGRAPVALQALLVPHNEEASGGAGCRSGVGRQVATAAVAHAGRHLHDYAESKLVIG